MLRKLEARVIHVCTGCPLLSPAILYYVDCYQQKNHFSSCWKTLILRLLEKLRWTLSFLNFLSQIRYLQIADIPPYSCSYIEGNFTQTKRPLATILTEVEPMSLLYILYSEQTKVFAHHETHIYYCVIY